MHKKWLAVAWLVCAAGTLQAAPKGYVAVFDAADGMSAFMHPAVQLRTLATLSGRAPLKLTLADVWLEDKSGQFGPKHAYRCDSPGSFFMVLSAPDGRLSRDDVPINSARGTMGYALWEFACTRDNASAAKAGGTYMTYGSRACDVWTATMDEVTEKGAWTDSALVQRAWISGYMTAANHAHWGTATAQPNVLAEIGEGGQEFVYQWMDTYCKDHPLKDADMGGRLLFRGLVSQVAVADKAAKAGAKPPLRDPARVAVIRANLLTLARAP